MDPVTGLTLVFFVSLVQGTDLKFNFDCPVDVPFTWDATKETVSCADLKIDASASKCKPTITADNIDLTCEQAGVIKFYCPVGNTSYKIIDSYLFPGHKMYEYKCGDSIITAPGNLHLIEKATVPGNLRINEKIGK